MPFVKHISSSVPPGAARAIAPANGAFSHHQQQQF